jgi:hypothetical protein
LYFGVAWGPCVHGSQAFFKEKSPLGESLLWAAWALLLAAVFALCWHRQPVLRAGLIGVALMIHALLPVGLASPLTSAGVLFPATGFFGCLFAFVLCLAISGRFWKLATSLALAVFLSQMRNSPPRPIANWHAVNTSFGGAAYTASDPAATFQELKWISTRAQSSPKQVLLFPENALPNYSDAVTGERMDLPTITAQNTTILIGSNRPSGTFDHRENILLMRGATSGEYIQRIPIPVAMWGRDTDAHLLGPDTLRIGAHRAAVLLCCEQLLVIPVLQSFTFKPDVLLASSNLYWASGTNLDAVEEVCVEAWARLFRVPYLRAVNQ